MVAILEKFQSKGAKCLHEIPSEELTEMNLGTILCDCWFSFGENFSEIESTLRQLRHSEIPPSEKVAMIIQDLINCTEPISITRFVKALQKI